MMNRIVKAFRILTFNPENYILHVVAECYSENRIEEFDIDRKGFSNLMMWCGHDYNVLRVYKVYQ